MELKSYVRDVPDFPKPGIVFKDITPLLSDGAALQWTVNHLCDRYRGKIDLVVGVESRGFLVGGALAYALGIGIGLVRKKGKLPAETFRAEYELEYGSDTLEIHRDAFQHPCRVLVFDDLLATGGTAGAAVNLVRQLHGEVVECAFLIELSFLPGRKRLEPLPVYSMIRYASE